MTVGSRVEFGDHSKMGPSSIQLEFFFLILTFKFGVEVSFIGSAIVSLT